MHYDNAEKRRLDDNCPDFDVSAIFGLNLIYIGTCTQNKASRESEHYFEHRVQKKHRFLGALFSPVTTKAKE